MQEKQLCRHQHRWRRGRRRSRCWSGDSPVACGEDHRESGCAPAWRSTVEQISTCSWRRTPRQSRRMPGGGCDLVESCESGLLAGPVSPNREELTLEQVCWQNLWPHGGPTQEQPAPVGVHPMEATHDGALCKELQPVGKIHDGEVHGELSPAVGTPWWSSGREWGVFPVEEEGSSETKCDEPTPTPIPHPPAPLRGRSVRKLGGNWAWEEGRGEGKAVLRFFLISHYTSLILLVTN